MELPLRIGGVMRCCIASLNDSTTEEKEGAVVKCKYCGDSLVVKNGAWEKLWEERHERG